MQVNFALPALEKSSYSRLGSLCGERRHYCPCWQCGRKLCLATAVLGHIGSTSSGHHGDAFPKSPSLASTEAACADSPG